MPGRKYTAPNSNYRYGFNGKENDNEVKGEGNQQDYGFRIYDPRLGKFLSVDPITDEYPELTPYQFASNRPIDGIDLDGLEWFKFLSFRAALPILSYLTKDDVKAYVEVKRENPGAGILKTAIKASWRSGKNKIHFGLDVLGLIPGFGEGADFVNGGLYMLEKDYENASYSFAATFPFAGVAATGNKWAKNVLKFSDNAFHSAAGLVYKQGSKQGNRLSHVLEHTADNLGVDYHGIFDASSDGLIGLLDEAYSKAKSVNWNEKLAIGESETIDGITRSIRKEKDGKISENFVVDMHRKVGTEGGKKGSGETLTKVQISVDKGTSDVRTAFLRK